MLPAVMRPGGSIRPMIASAVSDLPQPDSPTIASVSPSPTSKAQVAHDRKVRVTSVESLAEIHDAENGLPCPGAGTHIGRLLIMHGGTSSEDRRLRACPRPRG